MAVMRAGKRAFGGSDVAADISAKYGYTGPLLKIFAENAGPVVHKWHHYIPLYDRYFSRFRGRPVRFLEIGVAHGGSLQLWRNYFGPEAVIYGIDINEACAKFNGQSGQVRIGSQADPKFLQSVVAEMDGIDVVLDDGSHQMDHIRASLKSLFPLLADGGTYMIEDLHTAYWEGFGGGLKNPSNFFHEVRRMIDDMHHWYHKEPEHDAERSAHISGIHVHDSIVVIDKNPVFAPVTSRIGN